MRAVRRWRPYPVDETCKLYLPFYKYGAEQSRIWDISGSGNHGTITGAVPASYPMLVPKASGSVTQANMRISAVNGTAFVDFSAASVLTDYLDYLLVIKDSSGRVIQGYIKAAGTGETLGDQLGINITFDVNTDGWATGGSATLASVAGGQSNNCLELTMVGGSTQSAFREYSQKINALLKASVYVKSGTSGNEAFQLRHQGGLIFASGITSGSWVQYSGYVNPGSTDAYWHLWKNTGTAGTMLFDEASLKQVLTPSTTGATIVSTKGGGTFNWEAKGPPFNYNDSSGYTYTIYSVPSYRGSAWFGDGVDDRIVHSSLNLGTTHTLHYWLLYRGLSGVIHGGAANYHGLRLTPTACAYNVGTTEITVTHSAAYGMPVLFSIDRNGTSVDFYQNGVKIGTTQTLVANNNLTVTDFLRYSDGTSYWNGILFDAMATNINKGAQEIRNFFELTRSKYGI